MRGRTDGVRGGRRRRIEWRGLVEAVPRFLLDGAVLRFLLVGVGSNVVNYVGYYLLLSAGAPVFLAAVCGYALGLLWSYHFGRTWVFGRRFAVEAAGIGRFLVVYAAGGLEMAVVATALVDGLGLHYAIGWFFGAGVAACNNFAGLRWWVFRAQKGTTHGAG